MPLGSSVTNLFHFQVIQWGSITVNCSCLLTGAPPPSQSPRPETVASQSTAPRPTPDPVCPQSEAIPSAASPCPHVGPGHFPFSLGKSSTSRHPPAPVLVSPQSPSPSAVLRKLTSDTLRRCPACCLSLACLGTQQIRYGKSEGLGYQ